MGQSTILRKGRGMQQDWRIVGACLLCGVALLRGDTVSAAASLSPATGLMIWDTGRSSTSPLAATAFTKVDSWTTIEKDEKPAAFRGDAVITNGRIAAVLRKSGASVEL